MEGTTLRWTDRFSTRAGNLDGQDSFHPGNCPDSLETPPEFDVESRLNLKTEAQSFSITLAEFVNGTFVPECVADRQLSGRTHFQFILGLVLTPDQVAGAFGIQSREKKPGARSASDWPYLGSLPL